MSERMRRRLYKNSSVYFFVLLIAITSLGPSGPALAAEDACAHPTVRSSTSTASWPR
jgi:hypothetical protein